MSEADEMFKKIGYNAINKTEYEIAYFNDRTNEEILFNLVGKTVEIYIEGADEGYYSQCMDMRELKAINKKVEELGWLDERNKI